MANVDDLFNCFDNEDETETNVPVTKPVVKETIDEHDESTENIVDIDDEK